MRNLSFNEFVDKMQQDFPKLWDKTPYCFSHVGEGWYQIIYDLSAILEPLLNSADDCNVAQVKEKFGGLRFYVDVHDDVEEDKFQKIHKLINEVESKSFKVCEKCGEPGKRVPSGWIKTLCEKCDQDRIRAKNYVKKIMREDSND